MDGVLGVWLACAGKGWQVVLALQVPEKRQADRLYVIDSIPYINKDKQVAGKSLQVLAVYKGSPTIISGLTVTVNISGTPHWTCQTLQDITAAFRISSLRLASRPVHLPATPLWFASLTPGGHGLGEIRSERPRVRPCGCLPRY